jgi:hypothetical protein
MQVISGRVRCTLVTPDISGAGCLHLSRRCSLSGEVLLGLGGVLVLSLSSTCYVSFD